MKKVFVLMMVLGLAIEAFGFSSRLPKGVESTRVEDETRIVAARTQQRPPSPLLREALPKLPKYENHKQDEVKQEKMIPLLWETAKIKGEAQTASWSQHVFDIIENEEADTFLPGTDDVEMFCPRYDELTNRERVNFWGFLVSAIVRFESNFNPTARYQESTMGTDPITHRPVFSEGLMQLSYQDMQGYKFCDFDWAADKGLNPKDPKKSILDPLKNLSCGVKILAHQIRRKGNIALSREQGGLYWSVLGLDSAHSKVPMIAEMTKKGIPACSVHQ